MRPADARSKVRYSVIAWCCDRLDHPQVGELLLSVGDIPVTSNDASTATG